MPFIDPRIARMAYESMMRDDLYKLVDPNPNLKSYVDSLYRSLFWHSVFVGIVTAIFLGLIFIVIIFPQVATMVGEM